MSEKKRRVLTAVPALCAVLASSMLLVPWSSNVGDGARGLIVGVCLGASIGAFLKLKRASAA